MSKRKKTKKKYRFVRRTLRVLIAVLFFFLFLVLFIRSSWGQNLIVQKAVNYVSNKTNTKVAINKLFITFDGDIQLNGLFLEDKKGDTLIYSKSLEANVPLFAMISGKSIGVDNLEWNGLRANIVRKDTLNNYNFQFLIDAFASENTAEVAKDTATNPVDIVLGTLNFKNINVNFKDDVLGIDSKFKIGSLAADIDKVDVNSMHFDVHEVGLKNSEISYIQKPTSIVLPATEVILPTITADKISINNTKAFYQSKIDNLSANVAITDFYSEIPSADLKKNSFDINTIQLHKSEILLALNSKDNQKVNNNTPVTFSWPAIDLKIDEIDFLENKVQYAVNNQKPSLNVFNPEALFIDNLHLKAKEIQLKDKQAELEIERFSFKEKSGLNLSKFQLAIKATDTKTSISDLKIAVNQNKISGNLQANYTSLSKLISLPENTNLQINLPSFNVWLKEIFRFQPQLKENEYLSKLSAKAFQGKLFIDGNLNDLKIENTSVNWGNATNVSLNGSIKNATNPDKLQLNLPNFKAETKRADLLQIVNEKELNLKLPEEILITGNVNGSLKSSKIDANINTSQGNAFVEGNLSNDTNISYNVKASITDYDLGELLQNENFGALSLSLQSNGTGENLNNLDAKLETNISKFQLQEYAIKDVSLEGNFKDGVGAISSNYKDDNLNLNLNGSIILDSVATQANVDLNVIGADLQALGLLNRNVKTGMEVSADFKGNLESYGIKSTIKNGVVVYDNNTYLLGAVNAEAFINKDTTAVKINNKMLNVNLQSNTDPETFSKGLQRHVLSYFYRDDKVSDTIKNPINLKLEAKISQTSLIKDVFLVNLKDIDTIDIALDFKEQERLLKANVSAPFINYSGNKLDSLSFSMDTDKESFNFNLGFKNIKAGPVDVPKTVITGNQTNNELALNFLGFHKGEKLMNVNTKITGNRDRLKFTVNKDSLILNKSKWSIPEENEIVLENNNLTFSNFRINKENQSIEITNNLKNVQKNHIALVYNNFNINEVFNYLNPEDEIANGVLNGDFVLVEPFTNTGVIADVSVSNFKVLNTNLGKLSMDAKSLGNNKYNFNTYLKEGDVDLDLKGGYFVNNNIANLNLDLDINQFKMNALKTLSLGEIKETSGSFSGEFKVTGTTSKPKYSGRLTFDNAVFNITKLNTKFTLKEEQLTVDNSGISMANFTVLDAKNNALTLSGDIKTESFINPEFDLKLKAENFRILNATQKDNPDLYGKVTFNTNATLTGDLQIPKVNANFTLGKDTDVTYVMPSTYANVEERDGVVAFVNRKNPDAILTQTEEQSAVISGFDISSQLKINKEAVVTIIINEDTGDNFKVSGEGDFLFTMVPNGRITFTGAYQVASGHYELTLYNLVNRKFLLAPGGRVTWSGDPFDAKLDVSAIYKLETSASSLMAAQISNEDASVQNKYKQVLPFQVYLNIDGELLQPKISFDLSMPEEEQGAIGGQVYVRVQQIKQQEEELNKQVFSLLVLNRFYPDAGSDGSFGGFASIARNNLNDAVSEQLNTFSDKLLGTSGIELDFGLNSFTDYQGDAPTDRTQLDVAAQKQLFNERLTVRVGSEIDIQGSSTTGEQTPLIGNVSLEYKITEDGRYRLKGFRKSEFENVIDGQTIVSGIGLIFTQEFNEFQELWKALLGSNSDKNTSEKKPKEEESQPKSAKESVNKKN
ncbi:translocation/assembly module TamB domain-containing protein [Polaribacter sp.]|uniref:translocation/assembly module TamB domain-containing protein n=1 Tax=Polaribacter sp. TaxID=1920175 RepID=UPI0035C7F8D5